ncbi:cell surface glycoprotein CD200 receptor 1-A-like [Bufo gargarizans]|uniref:cell surface glycoprotein CD200 receptor 1-A-like n=1 Tax=Bufo gargarizans TaxID=30331 RepID=UPI001CF53684|nr:cell surface glycoprotein CD200 receptor 1-A-like [Bufo gargarizans]
MNVSLLLIFSLLGVSRADVVRVRRGRPVVLQCEADPGDTLLSVIWKLHLYNSSCVISYKIEKDNTKTSYSSCSTRMRSDRLSLSISNAEVSDEGNYTCEVVNSNDTLFTYKLLQVLAQPSTYLKLNSDGSSECGAVGGNPPAEISWIPHSNNIITAILEEMDQTRTVISTLRTESLNETSGTCVVSHPTFLTPWTGIISLNGSNWIMYLVLGSVISFLLVLTSLIIWKRLYLRTCFKQVVNREAPKTHSHYEEDKQELEPYATYTQQDNVIYCVATKFIDIDQAVG